MRALRLHALIEMLYATGLRVSELVTLPRSVLAGDGRVLTIKGKGGRERLVPLNAGGARGARPLPQRRLRGRRCADGHDQMAVRLARRGGPLDAPAPGQELKELAAEAGLDPERVRRTCCATPLPAICSIAAPTCARCSSCSATPNLDHPDLYARAGRAAEEAGVRAPSAGGAEALTIDRRRGRARANYSLPRERASHAADAMAAVPRKLKDGRCPQCASS